jgi:hypothetical protein
MLILIKDKGMQVSGVNFHCSNKTNFVMKANTILFLTILSIVSCTPEKEIIPSQGKDIVGAFIGSFVFDLQVTEGFNSPNITNYLPPKKFTAKILRSDNNNQINLTNIHDLNTCVYANVSNQTFTIPLQNIGLEEELVGFDFTPDSPNKTLYIKGNGQLVEIPRTDTSPTSWEVDLEYSILYDDLPLWEVTGNSAKGILSDNSNAPCK